VKLRKATISFAMSVRLSVCLPACLSFHLSAWKNSAPTGRIFMKFYIWVFFQNLLRKFKFNYNLIRILCTFHEDQYTFLIISGSVLFRMRNVSDVSCTENQNTHFVLNKVLSENDNIIRHMRIAYWINKSTDTHSDYVTYWFSDAINVTRTHLNITT
jgi:hypothetical protein